MTIRIICDWQDRPTSERWMVWGADGIVLADLPSGYSAVPVGAVVDTAMDECRDIIREIDSTLFRVDEHDGWSASNLCERNPYVSDFARRLTFSLALLRAAKEGGNHLVVTTDSSFAAALSDLCRRNGIDCVWHGQKLDTARRVWRRLRHFAGYMRQHLRQRNALRASGMTPSRLAARDLWLMTWARAGSFDKGGLKQPDLYFGDLAKQLAGAGWKVGALGVPAVWMDPIEKIAVAAAAAGEGNCLVPAFFTIRGFIGSLARQFCLSRGLKNQFQVAGFGLFPLVRRALHQEWDGLVAFRASLLRDVGRMAAKLGCAPKVLLYPYENQPWEKQLLAGFRQHCPETLLVAYQHAIFACNFVSGEPTKAQISQRLMPDLLIATGEEFRQRALLHGFPAERVLLGGSFRFPHFTSQEKVREAEHGLSTVLVSLPLQLDESVEIVSVAAEAFAELPLKVIVSFHPMLDEASRQIIRRIMGGNVEFSDRPARELLKAADLLLYNSSGTVFDATALSVPSIYLAPLAGFRMDKMPRGNPLTCRNAGELRQMIEGFLAQPGQLQHHLVEMQKQMADVYHKQDFAVVAAALKSWSHS